MLNHRKIWQISGENEILSEALVNHLGVSKTTAQVLVNRGITSVEEARNFLTGSLENLLDPFMMHGVEAGVNRINKAIKGKERILVYGDYDVDGITSTTLLLDALEALGADCGYYIPHRLNEGYGLNLGGLAKARQEGYSLIITVDCGISSEAEVAWARQHGLDVVITDHHEPPEQIPEATAVINPKQHCCPYPFKELAGVGVAFKLSQALFLSRGQGERVYEYLDLVALGTIADIVPLKGENRILTKYGLPAIASGERVGVRALLTVANLVDCNIETEQVAFGLAPRLNAAGRMNHANEGVELLRERDFEVALAIAKALDRANRERQAVEAVIFEEAVRIVEEKNLLTEKALVVAQTDWHLGVVGIVASKLVHRYCRPVVLLSINGDTVKGSARSIPGFNLFETLQSCEEYLEKYGGHSQAAGLTLKIDDLDGFSRAFYDAAAAVITEEHMVECITVDRVVHFNEITANLYKQLIQLAPFGQGNPSPLLACRQAEVVDYRPVGSEGKHLKLKVKNRNFIMDAIGFNLSSCQEYVDLSDKIDFIFELKKNEWNGRSNLQLNLRDLKQYTTPDNPFVQPLQAGEDNLINQLFAHAAEYLVDDYYRNVGDKEEFYTKVVGVTFDNRQELVRRLKEGDTLYLVREHNNPHDRNAVKVECRSGEQVGYLNAHLARHFAPLLDKGEQYITLVSNVTGGEEKNYGLNVVIQKTQEKDFLEKRAILKDSRDKLQKLPEKELMEAIQTALLGPYDYRNSQLTALESLKEGNNTLAIFGTGRGKSAVFQTFAAKQAIQAEELTIIVYPLRALVNDQYEAMLSKLSTLGLRIYKGNGSLSASERAMLFAVLEAGDIDVLLTTPEFISFHMKKLLAMPKKIGFFVVDESHHISMASLAHRPTYKQISRIAEGLGHPLTLAVTATAGDEVAREIIDSLLIRALVIDPHIRANMHLVDKRGVDDKNEYVRQVVTAGGKTIIYINSRAKAVDLALMLREALPELAGQIAYYHAGLKNEHRQVIEKMFKEGKVKVIVATSAFGEGIDIPDVRNVILYHLNFNYTEFNQQCGRGGRDGETTHIHLICGNRDVRINEFILEITAPDREFLAALYKVLQQLKNGEGEIRITNKEIASLMEKAGIRLAKDSSVSTGLGILEELGLIRRESAGRDRQIFVNPHPDEKVSLDNSLRFIEGQEEKRAFQEFHQTFFTAPSEDLLAQINRPIYPREKSLLTLQFGQRISKTS